MTATESAHAEAGCAKAHNAPDPRAATADHVLTKLRIRTLIEELEAGNRLAMRETEAEAMWIRRMQDQTAKHLDVLLQMRTALDAIQSWIGGG